MSAQAKTARRSARGPWLWPLLIVVVGVILLLDNFLLLGDFNAAGLWPLLLVVAGAQILLRGDILPGATARTFGITRGSVESGTLEISAGEIDVDLRALDREGRLIAGQFASDSRPQLNVESNHAHLRMLRSATPWASFVDWQAAVALDLPWQFYVTTHLGQVHADLSGLIIEEALISTGMGDIRLITPDEVLGTIQLRSALGNIHVITPPGGRTRITVEGGPLFGLKVNEARYVAVDDAPGVYVSRDPDTSAPLVDVLVRGTFGDAYLT